MPRAFEFNGTYLAHLLHHLNACEHGTFLCNCERQRVTLNLPTTTTSAWDALAGPEYLNPDFVPDASILVPNLAACCIRPWTAYYCRGCELQLPEPSNLLEASVAALRKENAELRQQLLAAQQQEAPNGGPAEVVVVAEAATPTKVNAAPAAIATPISVTASPQRPSEPVEVSDADASAAAAAAAAMAAAAAAAAAATQEQSLQEETEEEELFETVRASVGIIAYERYSETGGPGDHSRSDSPEP